MNRIKPTTANLAEDCESCGYPFDTNDRCFAVDDDLAFCSVGCAKRHIAAGIEAESMNAQMEPTP